MFPIAAWLVGTFKPEKNYVAIPMDRVSEGVSAHQVDVVPVFLVRHGAEVTAVLAGVPPRDTLVSCGGEFVAVRSHRHYPASSAELDHVAVRVRGEEVLVSPQRITAAAGRREPPFIPRLPDGWEESSLHPDPSQCA